MFGKLFLPSLLFVSLTLTVLLSAKFSPTLAQTVSNYLYLNGNVGIGGTPPTYTPLQVTSPNGIGNGQIRFTNGLSGSTGWMAAGDSGCGGVGYLFFGRVLSSGNTTGLCGSNLYPDLTVSSTGNVGIGQSSPDSKLQVTGGTNGAMRVNADCGNNYTGISLNGTGLGGCNTYNILSSNSDQELYINAPSGHGIHFRQNNGDEMYINSAGNVGIGTTAPGSKLDIQSSVTSNQGSNSTQLWLTHANSSSFQGITFRGYSLVDSGIYQKAGDDNLYFGNWAGSGPWVDRVTFASNGNVGIGTTSPQQKLDVNGYLQVDSINGEGGTIKLMGNNGVNMHLENYNGDFRLVNSPWNAELFRVTQSGDVDADGNVFLGTHRFDSSGITDPNNQGLRLNGSGDSYIYELSATSNNLNVQQWNGSSWTSRIQVLSNGNTSINGNVDAKSYTQNGQPLSNGMTMISDVLLGSASPNIIFSNIPQGYKDLMIEASGRTDTSAGDYLYMYFNGDNGANYNIQYSEASGGSTWYGTQSKMNVLLTYGAGFGSATGITTVNIPDYSSTTYYKTEQSEGGRENSTSDYYSWNTFGQWANTSAINSITFAPYYGSNIAAGTRVTLYGLK